MERLMIWVLKLTSVALVFSAIEVSRWFWDSMWRNEWYVDWSSSLVIVLIANIVFFRSQDIVRTVMRKATFRLPSDQDWNGRHA